MGTLPTGARQIWAVPQRVNRVHVVARVLRRSAVPRAASCLALPRTLRARIGARTWRPIRATAGLAEGFVRRRLASSQAVARARVRFRVQAGKLIALVSAFRRVAVRCLIPSVASVWRAPARLRVPPRSRCVGRHASTCRSTRRTAGSAATSVRRAMFARRVNARRYRRYGWRPGWEPFQTS